jgi:predicted choloylglycine hydrolase
LKGKSFNTVGIVLGNWDMSDNIITNFSEESKGVLKKEYETMIEQTKEMLGECKRKALSKI